MMSSADTIYALATSPGKSGVAVLRLSGPEALPALKQLTGMADVIPRHAHYVTFYRRPGNDVLDRGLALYFPGPHSFTGEDVVECHLHGSHVVIREALEALSAMDGLRHAEPGEFTRRAFVNGKMDLMEAEGLADLIDAETSQQKIQAMRQMQGELSAFYERLRRDLTGCLAYLEAYIDFPDEEIPESVLQDLSQRLAQISGIITDALKDQGRGERLRDGISIVIMGAPNVGKSSLINAIAKRDVAIVSYQAGTTRDVIEVHLDMAGYPVVVVDTAGIRDSSDAVEQEGIRRALQRAEEADIRLVVLDGSEADEASRELVKGRSLVVVNKCDLMPQSARTAWEGRGCCLSTRTGEGMEQLLALLEARVTGLYSSDDAPMITRARHRAHLVEAHFHIEKSRTSLPLELRCEELRQAALAVGKITGKIQVDDVLEVIFSSFCIGK
jgi:tRNA modification GTPase